LTIADLGEELVFQLRSVLMRGRRGRRGGLGGRGGGRGQRFRFEPGEEDVHLTVLEMGEILTAQQIGLAFDKLHVEIVACGLRLPAKRIESVLVKSVQPFPVTLQFFPQQFFSTHEQSHFEAFLFLSAKALEKK
jgi:hypothetical protein